MPVGVLHAVCCVYFFWPTALLDLFVCLHVKSNDLSTLNVITTEAKRAAPASECGFVSKGRQQTLTKLQEISKSYDLFL